MTLSEMKARKKELGLSNKEISRRSGVPLGTVQKIFGGVTEAPRMETIIALERVLRRDTDGYAAGSSGSGRPLYVAEPVPAYNAGPSFRHVKKQGEYTLEDYYALPDDRRVELIDGVIYDMAAPSHEHQLISGELSYQLQDFVKKNGGGCRVYTAPLDVQLDRDKRTMVQPDILVICDHDKVNSSGIFGAPDFIIEILSPATAKTDVTIKLYKYMKAGVREYWVVDPENRQVFVYMKKEESILLVTYTFDDLVPVGIWDGRCRVDFPEIARELDIWRNER